MAEAAKVKKPKPPPPAPPPAVATAALMIRGAAARVLGIRPGPCGGDMQQVWISEPGCGKITLSLEGSKREPFPKEDVHDLLIEAVETVANELAISALAVSQFQLDRKTAEERYGDAMYDGKSERKDVLRLGYIPGAALVELPQGWTLCASTGACGAISFEYGEEGSKKKPDTILLWKQKKLTIKFKVGHPDAAGVAAADGKPPAPEAVRVLDSSAVRTQIVGIDVEAEGGAEPFRERAPSGEAKKAVAAEEEEEEEMVVDPWEVKGKIDYAKLVDKFGTKLLDEALLARMERLTVGKGNVKALHRFFRRGIFFSHRDLDQLFTCVEKGQPFYLYTGRGPSSAAMHLGHLIPFLMTKWLQEAFNVPLVIQMTDDEKFLWKGEYHDERGDNLMYFRQLTTENAKDIIATGFDHSKTFIFSDLDYVGHMYPNIVRIQKAITYNTARAIFGFQGDNNIGQSSFVAIQAAPSFPSSFRVPLKNQPNLACLIPCAIDQDNYFRATREVAHKLVPKSHPLKGKPALVHAKFFPPLQGASGKMSASDTSSAIFLTDTAEEIETKINKYAYSGGQQYAKDQREKGADLDVDVSYQWLRFFLEDDEELERIGREYGSGQGEYWNTGAVKKKLIDVLQKLVGEHQARRTKVTDEEVARWMKVRELEF